MKDRAADAFARPMFVPSIGVAIRSFSDEINRQAEDNQLYQHPDDFDLYDLGVFDDSDASFQLHEKPIQIAIGKQVKINTVE
jgi:hypothetical protein